MFCVSLISNNRNQNQNKNIHIKYISLYIIHNNILNQKLQRDLGSSVPTPPRAGAPATQAPQIPRTVLKENTGTPPD